MTKGDMILIPFPFTNLIGNKLRPAIVLFHNEHDVTICFVTTQIKLIEPTDIEIYPSQQNGIKKHSLIKTSKIATVDKSLAIGKMGELSRSELENLNTNLKILLQIN